jgi:ribosomal protein S12 methylthiotransferase
MIAQLGAKGWELTPEAADADAVVINTCAFIDPAKAESTEVILEHAQAKRPGQQLIVAGCLSQRYGEQLRTLIPEIDGIVGTGSYSAIAEVLEEAGRGAAPVRLAFEGEPEHDFLPRLITTPRATAYLKISEGCDHPCTFCIIPKLRGGFRSRTAESLVAEATALAESGTKELILIAQDSSMWGRDRGIGQGGLAGLLAQLNAIEGLAWIRLLYLYPATIDGQLIEAMATLEKVCPYLDMPLQHAHPEVLKAMRRPFNGERYHEILADFRARIPGLTMRSTFIVGFPGEREEHVAYLEEWIERAELDRVGFFTYSREDDTPAAELAGQVPAREKRRRLVRLREAQRRASERARARRIGQRVAVLIEEQRTLKKSDPIAAALDTREVSLGRSMGEAPGVDGAVYVAGALPIGEFTQVELRGTTSFDFFGVPAEELVTVG